LKGMVFLIRVPVSLPPSINALVLGLM